MNPAHAFFRRSSKALLHLLRARDGVTAVEFAFVAPVLILILFAIIEFSLIMMVNNIMESATNMSSRLGKTGFIAAGKTREDTITAAVRERAGSLIDPDRLSVSTKVYRTFGEINRPEPWHDTNGNGVPDPGEYTDINGNGVYDTDMARAGYGNAGDIVVYTIKYPWSITTPIMRELIGNESGEYPLTAHAVVKNEPYDKH